MHTIFFLQVLLFADCWFCTFCILEKYIFFKHRLLTSNLQHNYTIILMLKMFVPTRLKKLVVAKVSNPAEDGHEIQFQVNHLSHMLLTLELLPIIQDTARSTGDGRIVFISSVAHDSGVFDPDNLEGQQSLCWIKVLQSLKAIQRTQTHHSV